MCIILKLLKLVADFTITNNENKKVNMLHVIRKYKLSLVDHNFKLSKYESEIISELKSFFCTLKCDQGMIDKDVFYYSYKNRCMFVYYSEVLQIDLNEDVVEHFGFFNLKRSDIYLLVIEWLFYVYRLEIIEVSNTFQEELEN